MKETEKVDVFREIVRSRKRWLRQVYKEAEGSHFSCEKFHQKGFRNFIKSLDEVSRTGDSAAVVLYANTLGIIASFPAADVISKSLRTLVASLGEETETIKDLGRVVYTVACRARDNPPRYDILKIPGIRGRGFKYANAVLESLKAQLQK